MKRAIINFIRYPVRQGLFLGFVILAKFRKKNGLISVKPAKVKFPFWLRPNTSDVPTFDEVFIANQYDFDLGFVPKTIIDCGANIGLASIYFKNKFPDAMIVSVEPEVTNFEMLQKNISPYSNLFCVHAGIWHKEAKLVGSEKFGTEKWTFSVEEAGEDNNDAGLMPAISIDSIMEKYSISVIDLLKIDIEGAELELFSQNIENWLPKTKCIVIELHDRLRKGTGKAFFKATSQYDFSYYQNSVNFFCINNRLVNS